MNAREERGLIIAKLQTIVPTETDGVFMVPSQTAGARKYRVNIKAQTCTCPDHETTGGKCKHLFAAEFSITREFNADGTVTETEVLTLTKRKTYKQDWPAYNHAQATEKNRLQVLLHDICRNLAEKDESKKRGPKAHLVKDQIFSIVYKVYCGFSSRRFSCDLKEAFDRGFLSRSIPGMKTTAFMEDEALTPILTELVSKSASPLAAVETDFAIDSTGFSSYRCEKWFDEKWGTLKSKAVWMKAHAAVGVKTNCITAVTVLEKFTGDSPEFPALVKKTAENFTVNEVSGDKAYASEENFQAVVNVGGTGFMPFKSNATGGIGGLFGKMFHYFQFQRDEYLEHYHKRSNVESTFSAVKRKFGSHILSKTDTAMKNEVLCKCIAQNLTCLIQEEDTLGISPIFWKDENVPSCNAIADRATQIIGIS